jgi:hypothetical protein
VRLDRAFLAPLLFRFLFSYGIASRQGRSDLRTCEDQREVERRYAADNAEGFSLKNSPVKNRV